MRRFVLLAAVVGALVVPAAASAYPVPGDLSPATQFSQDCPPRPADATVNGGNPNIVDVNNDSIAAGATKTYTSAAAAASGPANFVVRNSGGGPMDVSINSQDAGGTWHTEGSWYLPANNFSIDQLLQLPSGPVQVLVKNGASSAQTFSVVVEAGYASNADTFIAQELADACYRAQQERGAAHSDAQAIAAAVNGLNPKGTTLGDIKDAVNGLSANGTTLDTVHSDLGKVHNDLVTLNSTVAAGTSSSGTTGSNVSLDGPVQLSPADRQLSADVGNQLNGDLWIIVGVMVGCFATGFAINRLFPAR